MRTFQTWITLQEAEHSLVYYHGTSLQNLPNLLRTGIEMRKPIASHATFAVYLTPNIELAARYSIGEMNDRKKQIPAILEINLSPTPQLIRKMAYDNFDRPENAWDFDQSETADREAVRDIETAIQTLVKRIVPSSGYFYFDLDKFANNGKEDLFKFNGLNLYQIAYNAIAEVYHSNFIDKKRILSFIKQAFPPGNFNDFFQITPSGTLRVTPKYLTFYNQYQYHHKVPPQAIKFVWVRKDDFPNIKGIEEKKIGIEELPDESKDRLEKLQSLLYDLHSFINDALYDEYFDEIDFDKDLDRYSSEISELDPDITDELNNTLDNIKTLFSDRENNGAEIEDELNNLRDFVPHEDWGESRIKDHSLWIKISVVAATRLPIGTVPLSS